MTVVDGRRLPAGAALHADVAIVGAGPAGIVLALELERSGRSVLLVESGGVGYDPAAQDLGRTAEEDPQHDPMALSTRRQVGGATNQWGGRCVPFDPIDFERRSIAGDAEWPLTHEDVASYLPRACEWLECGDATFDARAIPELAGRPLLPGFTDGQVVTSRLERWSSPTNFRRRHLRALRRSRAITLATHLTCTEVVRRPEARAVERLELRGPAGERVLAFAQSYVVAAGGVESTRLLLASDRHHPGGIGDHSGHLGRWYMAHVETRVAEVQLNLPPSAVVSGHERDRDGVYARRRFALSEELQRALRLPNAVFWLVSPRMADPRHRSGILSLSYLLLRSPVGRRLVAPAIRRAHLGARPSGRRDLRLHATNVLQQLGSSLAVVTRFGYGRFLRRGRKLPGFFFRNPSHRYALVYHAEHLPNPESRVELADVVDAVGMPRAVTRLRYSDADVEAVERAHRALDRVLREQGLGHVEFLFDDVAAAARQQVRGGTHQLGSTRMSAGPDDGVVDPELAVHGFEDLFVLSGSTFVTSSQANPTLMLVALAVRLAERLGGRQAAAGRPASARPKRASALPISA